MGWKQDNQPPPLPPPIMIEDEEEFELQPILHGPVKSRGDSNLHWLVSWKACDPVYTTARHQELPSGVMQQKP